MRRLFLAGLLGTLIPFGAVAQDRITLNQENVSDARGLLNVFNLFRNACLDQPVSKGLAEALAPEGFGVVTSAAHLEFDEGPRPNGPWVISVTGTEQGDWDAGHPFVLLSAPRDGEPDGACTVYWKRAWDYDENLDALAQGLFGAMDGQISYYLQSILRSPPPASMRANGVLSHVSDWATVCWDGQSCFFNIVYEFHVERGINMFLTRK